MCCVVIIKEASRSYGCRSTRAPGGDRETLIYLLSGACLTSAFGGVKNCRLLFALDSVVACFVWQAIARGLSRAELAKQEEVLLRSIDVCSKEAISDIVGSYWHTGWMELGNRLHDNGKDAISLHIPQ